MRAGIFLLCLAAARLSALPRQKVGKKAAFSILVFCITFGGWHEQPGIATACAQVLCVQEQESSAVHGGKLLIIRRIV
jgi:hypothetical protein